MKKQNLFLGFLVLAFGIVMLAACGNEDTSSAVEPEDENGYEAIEAESSLDPNNPVTLSFFHADGVLDMRFDDAVAQEITRLTGVTLDITAPMAGDEGTDIGLMVAQGEFPDLIYAKGSIDILIGANALLPLDDLIMSNRGSNLQALYGDLIGRLRQSEDDPYMFHVGTFGVDEAVLETAGTAKIQMSAMQALGFPELNSLEDFAQAIRDYMEITDIEDPIGLALQGQDWRWFITVGNPAGFALGHMDDGEWVIDEENQTATFKYLTPGFAEYFEFLNGLYLEGILHNESFTHTQDMYEALIASGRVIAVMDQGWNIGGTQTALRAAGEEWREFMPLAVTLDGDVEPAITRPTGFTGGWGISIAADSPNADVAFDFLNWMASEEAQILINWGIEGYHWEMVDGVRTFLPEVAEARQTNPDFDIETGVGLYTEGFPNWGNNAVDSTGNPISADNLDAIIENFSDAQLTVLEAYGHTTFIDFFPNPDTFTTPRHGAAWMLPVPSGSNLEIIQTQLIEFSQPAIARAIMAPAGEFADRWQYVIDGLHRFGVEQANEYMTEMVRSQINLWERD